MPKNQKTPTNNENLEEIPSEVMEMISGGAGEGIYVCKVCGSTFVSANAYAVHLSGHLKKKSFKA